MNFHRSLAFKFPFKVHKSIPNLSKTRELLTNILHGLARKFCITKKNPKTNSAECMYLVSSIFWGKFIEWIVVYVVQVVFDRLCVVSGRLVCFTANWNGKNATVACWEAIACRNLSNPAPLPCNESEQNKLKIH